MLIFSATSGSAAANAAPLVSNISYGISASGGGSLEVWIDPMGRETTWEIRLNCPGESRCQHSEGTLPATSKAYESDLAFTGLERGATYNYVVEARNSTGETFRSGEFVAVATPPGACPDGGCGPEEPYRPPELPWSNKSGEEASARTVAEQRAKEQSEQQAKEVAQRAEEQVREANAKVLRAREDHVACVVPALKGETLTSARRALRRAHCRIGRIHQSIHRHGASYVSAQSFSAGRRLARGARVALWIGPALHDHARRR
ncbi:MAG TPA: PASTA domain-containing protein [Solirubrobacteraceae bacterium]|nr:PASTA domain-containing protein [Solirubrobacteraceae bacterium]